jgi:hypothetical protein
MHGRRVWGPSALSMDNKPWLCWSNLLGMCDSMVSKISPCMARTLCNFIGAILECLGLCTLPHFRPKGTEGFKCHKLATLGGSSTNFFTLGVRSSYGGYIRG